MMTLTGLQLHFYPTCTYMLEIDILYLQEILFLLIVEARLHHNLLQWLIMVYANYAKYSDMLEIEGSHVNLQTSYKLLN